MLDVFLSYAREDQDKARLLASALEEKALTVFWDREVPVGKTWRSVIGEALDGASVVIVLWSIRSIESEWVIAEADSGRLQGKLVPVLLDDVEPPMPFGSIRNADLRGWDGSTTHLGFDELARVVLSITGRPQDHPVPADLPGETIAVDPAQSYKRLPRASKTRVFVAHASGDKPLLKPILVTLIDQGFQLWVDKPQQIGLGAGY